jgi:hypothetical protein
VHFLRFELAAPAIAAFKGGADVAIGVDHPAYHAEIPALAADVRAALQADLA